MKEIQQPTRINFKTGHFKANGNDYYIASYLPVGRDLKYSLLVPKLAFGVDFMGIFSMLSKFYKAATEWELPGRALHEIATDSRNAMEAVKRAGEDKERVPIYYELCALFINKIDENPATIDDATIQSKINDWVMEGIPREDFFTLAINSIKGLTEQWLQLQGELLEAEKTMELKSDGGVDLKSSMPQDKKSESKSE